MVPFLRKLRALGHVNVSSRGRHDMCSAGGQRRRRIDRKSSDVQGDGDGSLLRDPVDMGAVTA